jgi:hypothetical protein
MPTEGRRFLLLAGPPEQGVPFKTPLFASFQTCSLQTTVPDNSPAPDQGGEHDFGSDAER